MGGRRLSRRLRGPGLKLAEWPEKAAELLPPSDLRLEIAPRDGDARSARFEA